MFERLRNYMRGLAEGGRVAIARRVVVGAILVAGTACVAGAIGMVAIGDIFSAGGLAADAAAFFGAAAAIELTRRSRIYLRNRNAGQDDHDAVVRAEERQQVQVQPLPGPGQFHGVGVGNQTQQTGARVARVVQVAPFFPTQDTANPLAASGVAEGNSADNTGGEELSIPISAAAATTPKARRLSATGATRAQSDREMQENPLIRL